MGNWKQIAKYAGAAILLALSCYHFVNSAHHAGAFGFVDFSIFLQEAENFLESGELYAHIDNMEAYAPGTPVYKFPPLYAMLLLPLVAGGISEHIYTYHWIFQIICYLLAAVLAIQLLNRPKNGWFLVLAAVAVLNFEPFFETLYRLQIETALLLLLTLCLLLHIKGKDALAGTALGICVMLKIYPALLLVYFIMRRRWTAIAWCLGAMVLIQTASLIIIGPQQNYIFFFKILPSMMGEQPKLILENFGIAGYLQSLLGLTPAAAKRVAQLICLALLATSLYALRRGDSRELRFTLFIPLMLLFLPNSWANYQLLLLLPLLVVLRSCISKTRPRPELAAALLIAYLLALFYAPCADASQPYPCAVTPLFLGLWQFPRPFHDGLVALRIFASLALWGSAIFLLLERSASCARHRS
jgi:hypothetical protein